jgi:DNA-directed RNA polymerase specialized sigma subunit
LLEAVAEFEPISDLDFVPFAMPFIVGAILDYFKDRGWAVRKPGQLATQKAIVDQVLESFEHRFNRPPTIPEIVDATGLSAEMVLQTMDSPSQ